MAIFRGGKKNSVSNMTSKKPTKEYSYIHIDRQYMSSAT